MIGDSKREPGFQEIPQGPSSSSISPVSLEDSRQIDRSSVFPVRIAKLSSKGALKLKKILILFALIVVILATFAFIYFKVQTVPQNEQSNGDQIASQAKTNQLQPKQELHDQLKANRESQQKQSTINEKLLSQNQTQKKSQIKTFQTFNQKQISVSNQTLNSNKKNQKQGETKPLDTTVIEDAFVLSKQHPFECQPQQPIFHYFHQQEKGLYYRTPYQLFFPACLTSNGPKQSKFGRIQIQSWYKFRQIIQWARKYAYKSDLLLFDSPNYFNMLQIVILSKFVGKKGTLHLIGSAKNDCFERVRVFHKINNVKFVLRNKGLYKKYNTVITLNEDFFREEENSGLWDNPKVKVLAKLGKMPKTTQIKFKQLETAKNIMVHKVSFNNSDCKSVIKAQKSDFEEGFYQFIPAKLQKTYHKQLIESTEVDQQGPFMKELKQKYEEFKTKLPSPAQKKDITKIVENFPIPSKELTKISDKQAQVWQTQTEIVQWVKNRTRINSTVYLQQRSQNLLTVLNIAKLVPQGKILLSVQNSSWEALQRAADRLSLKNIQLTQAKEAWLSAQFVITDNKTTIQNLTADKNLNQRVILGFFGQSVSQDSKQLLYRLYPSFHIRRVAILPSYYFGYEIFENFLWISDQPKGFFQIQQKGYVVFVFWNQGINELTPNRKFAIEEIIRVNSVQVKVVAPTLLPYFVLPDVPLHKAFEFLTPVHKSDYLRCYFMHNIGGGYSDVKHLHFDFLPYLQKVFKGPQDMYAAGYHELFPHDIACNQQPGQSLCARIKPNYLKIFGNGLYIFKKHSPITKYWFTKAHQILDRKYEALKSNRYLNPRDVYGKKTIVNGKQVISKYPLRWAELHGQIVSKAQWANFGHYYVDMPYVIPTDYQ